MTSHNHLSFHIKVTAKQITFNTTNNHLNRVSSDTLIENEDLFLFASGVPGNLYFSSGMTLILLFDI